MKKTVLLIIFLSFLLCGCTGYREIERGYLVSAIGFSQENDNSKIYIEALLSSDTSDKSSKRVVLTAKGASVEDAFQNLLKSLVKPLYFEHLGALIFEKNINYDAVNFLKNAADINYGIFLVKTDNVDALFKADTPNGMLGYDIIGLLKTNNITDCQVYKTNRKCFYLPTINFLDNHLKIEPKE